MKAPQTKSVRPQAESLAGRVIVLLEDDELIRRATERMLRRFGAVVVTGASSGQVLAELATEKLIPDCVIADYWLNHDENGVAAAESVRQASGPTILGLIITGDLSEEISREVGQAGFRLLRKPVNVDSFLDAIIRSR